MLNFCNGFHLFINAKYYICNVIIRLVDILYQNMPNDKHRSKIIISAILSVTLVHNVLKYNLIKL